MKPWLEEAESSFGRVRRVRCPGRIEGIAAHWQIAAGLLGIDPPRFAQ